MKKIISAVAIATISAGVLFAGGVENKTNMSAGYIRNPSRNTECLRPEAAFYNIGGTAFMDDGLYVELGNQFVIKKYSHSYYNNNYSDKTNVYLYPNADIVFKTGHFSAFANFGIYAGGGKLNYNNGTIAIGKQFLEKAKVYPAGSTLKTAFTMASVDHKLKVNSITYGGEVGAGYNLGDKIAFAAAFRAVYGSQQMKLISPWFRLMGNTTSSISCSADAWGFGGLFGVHYKPIETLDIALQYQTLTKIKYKVKSVSGKILASGIGISEGSTYRADLPSVLNAGIGYQVLEPLYVSASFDYYMNQFYAHQDSVLVQTVGKTKYKNSWEAGIGADYKINEKISVSSGIDYSKQGTNSSSNSIFNPILDSFLVGGGIEVKPIEKLTVTGGAMYVRYFETEYSSLKLNKNVVMLSLGLTYKFDVNK